MGMWAPANLHPLQAYMAEVAAEGPRQQDWVIMGLS